MVAGRDVRVFEVAPHVPAVRVEEGEETAEPRLVERARAAEESERREQVRRAQSRLHRARPVRPEADGVLRAPTFDLREELLRQSLVARPGVRAPEREKLAEP